MAVAAVSQVSLRQVLSKVLLGTTMLEKRTPVLSGAAPLFPEILSIIFMHVYYTSANQTFGHVVPADAPLLLLQVCRSWRVAAEGTTGLWTKLCLTVDLRGLVVIAPEMKRLWFGTSGGPLTLVLDVCQVLPPSSRRIRPVDVRTLAMDRWQDVHLCWPASMILALIDNVKGRLPMLQKLTLDPPPMVSNQTFPYSHLPVSLSAAASQLQALELGQYFWLPFSPR